MSEFSTSKRLTAELLGTAFLLAIVVGSGIMAENLSGGNTGVALMANAVATGAGLYALILMFAPISGAHFNPVVSLVATLQGDLTWKQCVCYVVAQFWGAVIGVMIAHAMFELPLIQSSAHLRTGGAQWLSEIVATFGLLMVILTTSKTKPVVTPACVALYIVSAYWFTSSTSFANPAVTFARTLTDTFSGIFPSHAPMFMVMQIVGALLAFVIFGWLFKTKKTS